MTYYCPFCWFESSDSFETCPRCREDLSRWKAMGYAERLALSLKHPEPETRHRAARILGLLKAKQALPALMQAAQETRDIYLLPDIVWALGEIQDPASLPQLQDFVRHPSFLVRKEAVQALGKLGGAPALESVSAACYGSGRIGSRGRPRDFKHDEGERHRVRKYPCSLKERIFNYRKVKSTSSGGLSRGVSCPPVHGSGLKRPGASVDATPGALSPWMPLFAEDGCMDRPSFIWISWSRRGRPLISRGPCPVSGRLDAFGTRAPV